MNFCLIYLIGRWISTVGTEELSDNAGWGYLILTVAITLLSYTATKVLSYDDAEMKNFILGYSYALPFVMLQAVSLFLIFSRVQIHSKAINWCAASCLSIYLIHMHPAIKQIGYYDFTESLYDRAFLEHTVVLVSLITVVFFGSILIDKVRIALSDFIFKQFSELGCLQGRL